MKHWRIKLDVACVAALAVTATIALCGCRTGEASEPVETTCEPTTIATVAETTEAITEPTETQPPVTEPTEPPVTLYEVPLDEELQLHIISEAEAHGIDPAIVVAMAWKESTYNPEAIGDNGSSFGLLQVQPRWHSSRMEKLGCPDLLDPYQNVTVGIDYLCELVSRYGDLGAALTGYNQGHYNGTVTGYAWTVLDKAEELRGETYVLYR